MRAGRRLTLTVFHGCVNLAFVAASLWVVAVVVALGIMKAEDLDGWAYQASLPTLAFACFYASIPAARIIVRSLPPNEGGRSWVVRVLLLAVGFWVADQVMGWTGLALPDSDVDFFQHALAMAYVMLVRCAFVAALLRYVAVWLGRHDRGVLYLRSFSEARADQGVARAVIRSLPRGLRFRSLASTRQRSGHFELFMTAFAGWNWLRPLRAAPTFLVANDERWRDWVRAEVRRARVIVVECSSSSPGLQDELAIIDEERARPRTLCVASESARAPVLCPDLLYRTSWVAALPRILFLFLFGALVADVMQDLVFGAWLLVVLYSCWVALISLQPDLPRANRRALREAMQRALDAGDTATA